MIDLLGLDAEQPWNTETAYQHLKWLGYADTKRTAERRLHALELLPQALQPEHLCDETDRPPNLLTLHWDIDQARKKRQLVLFAQLHTLANDKPCLYLNDARGAWYWLPLADRKQNTIYDAIARIQLYLGKPIALIPHGPLVGYLRHQHFTDSINLCIHAYREPVAKDSAGIIADGAPHTTLPPHLRKLECDAISMIREVVSSSTRAAILVSMGKKSAVLFHLLKKAFHPFPPPICLMHLEHKQSQLVNDYRTHWQSTQKDIPWIIHGALLHGYNHNTDGDAEHMLVSDEGAHAAPITHSTLSTFSALHGIDTFLSGVLQETELTEHNHWLDPTKMTRYWQMYHTMHQPRVAHPLYQWHELDILEYIQRQAIPIMSLYFAKPRHVVARNGNYIIVDNETFVLNPDETIELRNVRIQHLDNNGVLNAVDSSAETIAQIIKETNNQPIKPLSAKPARSQSRARKNASIKKRISYDNRP